MQRPAYPRDATATVRRIRVRRKTLAAGLLAALALSAPLLAGAPTAASGADPPNIVVIMTDDQTLSDLDSMPLTRSLIGDQGVTFSRFYVSFPLCCPSRATFLTGQYAHNHGVQSNKAPNGGFYKFDNHNALPVWMKAAGYHTIHVGKYLNQYGDQNPTQIPEGWDEWDAGVSSSAYSYWGYTLNQNGVLHTYGDNDIEDPALYQTDVYRQIAVDAIDNNAGSTPFFLNFWPLAPHVQTLAPGLTRPAPRYKGTLASLPLPHPPSFNEANVSDKPRFIRSVPRLTASGISRLTKRFHDRRESLLSVDDAVQAIVQALTDTGELDNTYIFFTSDNGYFQGEHRFDRGKNLPYEPSTHVPLLLRGPGIPAGQASGELVANVDFAPTIAAIAGALPSKPMDGRSLLPYATDTTLRSRRPILLEAGSSSTETSSNRRRAGISAKAFLAPFKSVVSGRYKYVLYSDGEEELYDLARDPDELTNRVRDPRYGRPLRRLRKALGALRDCAATTCRAEIRRVPPPAP